MATSGIAFGRPAMPPQWTSSSREAIFMKTMQSRRSDICRERQAVGSPSIEGS